MMDGSIPPSSSRSQQQHNHHNQHQHQHPPSSSSSSSTIPTTVSSATSSSSSSSAAVFRPRRSDDWQQYRPIVEQLYLNNQLKLRDVKIIMERDHHLVATYVSISVPFWVYNKLTACIEKNSTKIVSPHGTFARTSRPKRSMS